MVKEYKEQLLENEQPAIQLTVMENRKRPGEQIFIREDGKIGFPTINSIRADFGDVVRGKVKIDEGSYFFVEIQEIVQKNTPNTKEEK